MNIDQSGGVGFPGSLAIVGGPALLLDCTNHTKTTGADSPAIVFYAAALGFLTWAIIEGEWKLSAPPAVQNTYQPEQNSPTPLLLSIPLLVAAFYFFAGNRFTFFHATLAGGDFSFCVRSFD